MKKISALTNEQRKFIFSETAYKMNVQPVVIEKDYWVCLVLDFLSSLNNFLKRDYKMMENMFFGNYPSYEELINKLALIQKILNNL